MYMRIICFTYRFEAYLQLVELESTKETYHEIEFLTWTRDISFELKSHDFR